MKTTDYIVKLLESYGIKHIFMVVGGGSMHLNDSIGKSKIKYICMHHEQACAMAAEGYARASGKLAVVCVTTGPGSTNVLTGIMGQWTDSVPVLYLAGQVMQSVSYKRIKGLRQLGDQEVNIIDMVKPIVKYAGLIGKQSVTKVVIDRAIKEAISGRPGPVWVEVPIEFRRPGCIKK